MVLIVSGTRSTLDSDVELLKLLLSGSGGNPSLPGLWLLRKKAVALGLMSGTPSPDPEGLSTEHLRLLVPRNHTLNGIWDQSPGMLGTSSLWQAEAMTWHGNSKPWPIQTLGGFRAPSNFETESPLLGF